jgi:hypothetical protein
VFENNVDVNFWSYGGGSSRRIGNEDFHNLHSSSDIPGITKSGITGWTGHLTGISDP